MAGSILSATTDFLIEELGTLALHEFQLLWNVRRETNKLKQTLSSLKAVILDAEEQEASNHAVKEWVLELKDAVYEIEDLMDDFATEALRRRKIRKEMKVRSIFTMVKKLKYRYKMAHKMKQIRETLEGVADNRKNFNFIESHNNNGNPEARIVQRRARDRETGSHVRQEEVTGREEEKRALLEFLWDTTSVEENVSVVAIVGIGGLGKTTLAQLVYSNELVQQHFEFKRWVCVSEDFNVKTIVANILGCSADRELEQVQQDLKEEIEGKRYLLVLDDVWNDDREQWLRFKSLLIDGAKGSKIVVTTRSKKVGKITCTFSPIYLNGLDQEKSWELFTQLAFEKGEEPKNPKLISAGKGIVEKCVGVPLAIRTIASVLYFKSSESDWFYFKNVELMKIDEQKNRTFAMLKLSYDHLPSYLKKCFAFCSLFPKDYEIKKKSLIQLWMAQGFIQPLDKNRCLEDVGHEYFIELVWRSFFQDLEIDEYGDITTCKVHDLMHDLAVLVTEDEYKFIIQDVEGENISERTLHLSYGFIPEKIQTCLLNKNKIRTFLLPLQQKSSNLTGLDKVVYDSVISNFKCLRALELPGLQSEFLPNSISLLKHLRYLDLSNNVEIRRLPRSITMLHNLQTFKLNDCGNLKELPRDIRKLTSLRHLELDNTNLTHMPHGLSQLASLQALTLFVLNKKNGAYSKLIGGIDELRGLNSLKGHLHIKGLEHLRCEAMEIGVADIAHKENLHSLQFSWSVDDVDDSETTKDEIIL